MRFSRSHSEWDYDGDLSPIQDTKLSSIPRPVAEEAYKEYAAQYGTRQSLERLEERGGFDWPELATLLFERCERLEERIGEGA